MSYRPQCVPIPIDSRGIFKEVLTGNADYERKNRMTPKGIEPLTYGLRVHCSAN